MSVLDFLSGKIREPAECIISVDGEEIFGLYPFLIEATVQTSRSEATTATLNFETQRDEFGEWVVQDADVLKAWATVTITAAFGSYTEEVMRGYIREVKADYPTGSNATVTVTCQDDSLALDRQHQRKSWGADAPTSDMIIFNEIISRYALKPHAANGSGQSDIVVSQDATDIAFLKERAEANGYELVFSGGEVYSGPWRVDGDPQPTVMIQAGKETNCNSFSSNMDGHQPDSVAFDAAKTQGDGVVQESVVSDLPLMGNQPADSMSSGLDDFSWRMSREGGADQNALTAMAQKKANELAMKVKAEGELDGSLYGHVLRVAEPVGVDGVGDWLGGIYYVDSVAHTFNYDGYKQQFNLLRNAFGDNLESGVGSALAGVFK
ncbi:MAG: hypothetical protein R8K53_00580 [Mariprofundaceae bacterium]